MEYQRISCNLFDRLENLALSKSKVKIKYLTENQITEEIEGIIQNIFSENKAEFLSVNNVKIRLDKIQSIINS
ncbi:MAG: hypothetical protein IPH62_06880 [Ignavibacteriae bacterium]|nr:hypothetical protein [Ignavibacteriota bacterium]